MKTEVLSKSDSESSSAGSDSDRSSAALHVKLRCADYCRRRARNNNAVRKSRAKARQLEREQQRRLVELTKENMLLQQKAELLLKEIIVLKGLFPTFGVNPAPDINN